MKKQMYWYELSSVEDRAAIFNWTIFIFMEPGTSKCAHAAITANATFYGDRLVKKHLVNASNFCCWKQL